MLFLLFRVKILFLYERVSKRKIDIHMVAFSLFSMHCHNVLKYVIKIMQPTMYILGYDHSCT